jgi:hypothetical protein
MANRKLHIARRSALLVATILMFGIGTAHAATTFGYYSVSAGGQKRSETSGGSVYRYTVSGDSYDSLRAKIVFRDLQADGWGTYGRALQDAWDCTRTGCDWVRMSTDESSKYSTADGWRTTYLTEGRVWELGYRSQPSVCYHQPWWDPDDCKGPGWLEP